LQQMGDGWRDNLSAGEALLVCDVGGGTTDLTLVDVVDEDSNLELRRKVVCTGAVPSSERTNSANMAGFYQDQVCKLDIAAS